MTPTPQARSPEFEPEGSSPRVRNRGFDPGARAGRTDYLPHPSPVPQPAPALPTPVSTRPFVRVTARSFVATPSLVTSSAPLRTRTASAAAALAATTALLLCNIPLRAALLLLLLSLLCLLPIACTPRLHTTNHHNTLHLATHCKSDKPLHCDCIHCRISPPFSPPRLRLRRCYSANCCVAHVNCARCLICCRAALDICMHLVDAIHLLACLRYPIAAYAIVADGSIASTICAVLNGRLRRHVAMRSRNVRRFGVRWCAHQCVAAAACVAAIAAAATLACAPLPRYTSRPAAHIRRALPWTGHVRRLPFSRCLARARAATWC